MITRLIDKAIEAVSPLRALRRMQARRVLRSYLGAEPSRVSSGRTPKNQPADIELLGPFGADRLRAWSRELVRNNAYAWGVVDTIVSSVVGCGIKAQSVFETPEGDDIEEVNDRRDSVWSEWCEVCDINGQYTLEEIQSIAQREVVEAGEVLIRKIRTPGSVYRGIYRPVPLALEIIEADRLAGDKDNYASRLTASGENRIIRGVEVDDTGRPVAYWIYPDHPLQPYSYTREPERVPASEIMHLFRRERVGQTRGVSWFAPVVAAIRDLGTYLDNELQASAVASCFTVAIKTETPLGDLADPDGGSPVDSAGNKQRYIEPGMVMELAPGESVEGINPGRPATGAEPWIALILRQIAVGTGLSYETVARDYSQTSYSSSRTSQLEDRRRFRCWQQYLIRHLLQPTWDAFFDAASISGIRGFPTPSDVLADRRKVSPVEWQTPEWEWVDPQSEQAAAKDAIDSFMSDYQTELGSRGRAWRAVFYQRKKEQDLKKKLGLLTPQEQQLAISAAQSAPATPSEAQAVVAQRIMRDCGTGAGGFKEGNTCGGGGSSIGSGSTGDVYQKDGKVYKNATINGKKTKEAEVYSALSGKPGISEGGLEGDKIITPFYKNIISVDAIESDKRKTLAPVIEKGKDEIYSAVSEMSSAGYDYNDVLQFGVSSDKKPKLFDFSAAQKTDSQDSALRENAGHLKSFFEQFGMSKEAARVDKVVDIFLGSRGLADDDGSIDFMDDGTANQIRKLSENLGGKKPTHAYYASNARQVGIGGIAQTEHENGLKIILSSGPIAKSDVSKWELTPVFSLSSDSQRRTANAL